MSVTEVLVCIEMKKHSQQSVRKYPIMSGMPGTSASAFRAMNMELML